jgi:hypothetical protein
VNTTIALYSPITTINNIVPYPKITAAATTITIIMCTFRKMHKHQLQEVAVLHQKRLQILLVTRQYQAFSSRNTLMEFSGLPLSTE